MTSTRIAVSLSVAACLGLAGCENTAEKQRQAEQEQVAADQKRAAAEEQVRQKAAEAINAAQQEATKAQREADDKANAALAMLSKDQLDRMSKIHSAVEDLNGKINDLRAASNAEPAPSDKVEDSKVLGELAARRAILDADGRAVAEATTMTWPALKDKVDKDLDDYRSSARTATFHIRSAPR